MSESNDAKRPETAAVQEQEVEKRDIKAYFEQCSENLRNPDSPGQAYLEEQGIDVEAALQAGLGFDPAWKKNPNAIPFPALITPLGPNSYEVVGLRRATSAAPMWRQRGPFIPWNWGALEHGGVTFIVSGVLDGLAVMEEGYKSSSILGATNGPQYIKTLKAANWEPPEDAAYVLAFTKSPYDEKAAKTIGKWLRAKGAVVVDADLYGENGTRVYEAHRDDPKAFADAVKKAAEQAAKEAEEAGKTVDDAPTDVPKVWPGVYVDEERAVPNIKGLQQVPRAEKRSMRRKAFREAGDDIIRRFEESGIKAQTAIDNGLGYLPDRTQEDGPVFIMVPYGSRQVVNIPWGAPAQDGVYGRIDVPLWNQKIVRQKGIVVITRDVPDALAVIECGMNAAALVNGDPKRFLKYIARDRTKLNPLTAFVIALGAGEEDQKNADAIVTALKEKKVLAAKAPVSGESNSILEEYRKSPELVRKRLAVVQERCETALKKRKGILAKQEKAQKSKNKQGFKKNKFAKGGRGGGRPSKGKRAPQP